MLPGFPNLALPEDVRFDGRDDMGLLHFTDLAKGPAHNASFCLPAKGITTLALANKTAEVRQSFRPKSSPLPPLFQRQPRNFCPVDHHHY